MLLVNVLQGEKCMCVCVCVCVCVYARVCMQVCVNRQLSIIFYFVGLEKQIDFLQLRCFCTF